MNKENKPFISSDTILPEITLKALVLGFILTILLCASNAYLGLKVGNTVSASIPAAIIAMGVLRWFKQSNVLENNIVQTMASVGEAVVSGVAFITPAMLILHIWPSFDFVKIFILTVLGGFLGVLTTTLIRRVILDHKELKFPEGTAIGEVLKASAKSAADIKPLVIGGLVGALISFLQDGFQVVSDSFSVWSYRAGSIYGYGLGFSPALFGAGYIVGPGVGFAMLIGCIVGWILGVPLTAAYYGIPHAANATAAANALWSDHIRYIGVGAMLVGGLLTLLTLCKPIYIGVRLSLKNMHDISIDDETAGLPRTEKDISMKILALVGMGVLILGYFFLFVMYHHTIHGAGEFFNLVFCLLAIIFAMVFGFIFASLGAYFAGLVGATNCPGSGFLLAGVILFSLISLALFSIFYPDVLHSQAMKIAAFILLVNTFISCSISIANDSSQDLKSGRIVGATPWKQEAVLFLGVIIAAVVVGPVLELLYQAYGIGGAFPHPGMPHSQMLSAPQAAMMAAVVKGVLNHDLPWNMVYIGGVLGLIGFFLNGFLMTKGSLRFSVLAMGLGIYLPLDSSVPMILGGFVGYFSIVSLKRKAGRKRFYEDKTIRQRLHSLLLLACGMVAGSSLMGVVLAIPFAIEKSSDALKIVPNSFLPFADILAVLLFIGLCYWFYRRLNKPLPLED